MQVCYGELDFTDLDSRRAFLQDQFLNAIADHAPEAMRAFGRDVVSGFHKLDKLEKMLTWREINSPYRRSSEVTAVRRGVMSWSRRWNLDNEWYRERLYNELMVQQLRAANRNRTPAPLSDAVLYSVFASDRSNLSIPSPPDGLRNYLPIAETRKDYLQAIEHDALEAFKKSPLKHVEASQRRATVESIVRNVEAYCAKVEKCYLGANYVRAKEKRNLKEHLRWAVRFQVQNQTLSEIAESDRVEVQAVRQAVYGLLNHIRLEKRSDAKRGRILGNKNKRPEESIILRRLGR